MTDHPRFSRVTGGPESAYQSYHGAALVGGVFWLVDSARARRNRTQALAHGKSGARLSKLGMRPRTIVSFGLALVALCFGASLLLLLAR